MIGIKAQNMAIIGMGGDEMSVKKPLITGVVLLGIFCGVFLISFVIMSLVMEPQTVEAPVQTPNNSVAVMAETKTIGGHTIVKEQIYYRKCHHLETRELKDDVDFVGKTYAELERLGWQVYEADKGTVIISKDVEGFCPADDAKRHIAKCGEYLGVYKGPITMGGELLTELPISVSQLPQDWQTRVLEGGYQFPTEEELMDALENLDELL